MSNEDLPSINDIVEENNLPSYKDFIEEKELPSVEDYISESPKEEILVEEQENIDPVLSETAPEWAELVRLVNDVRKNIPEIPEIKYYDTELCEISEKILQIEKDYVRSDKIDILSVQNEEFEGKLSEIELKIPTVKYYDHDINTIYDKITDIKEEINNLPEVKYYEEDLKSLKLRIEQVNQDIPTFPDWIQEVQEVPDFSWIGKTFSLIDDDFNKVQGHIDLIKGKIDREVSAINESIEVKEFELKVDVKNLNENLDLTNDRIAQTKDKIYQEIKESSIRIWELRNTFKDDDKKLKKSILSEQNKLKQSLEKQIEKIDEQSVKADESILKFFNELKETVDTLPEVKYYDEDISSIKGDISSLKSGLEELNELSSLIKKDQKILKENYLLNEPPSEKETAGNQTDTLTPLDQKFATLDDLSNHYRLFINRITTQLSTMGGGGAGFIKDLDDVDITGLQNNYILKWDDPNNKWIAASGGNVGAGGTWHTDSIGISTNKFVGINTTSAVTGKSLYVDGDVQFTGNLSVGGTITKEDIKNLDSIGIITARSGITVTSNGLNVSGVSTISTGVGTVHIGLGQTALLVDGDARVTGILTVGRGSITLDPTKKTLTGIDDILVGSGVSISLAPLVRNKGKFVVDHSIINLKGYGSDLDGAYNRQSTSFVLTGAPSYIGSATFFNISGYYYFLHESDNSKIIIFNLVDGYWSAIYSNGSNFSSPSNGQNINPVTQQRFINPIRASFDGTGRAYPAAAAGIEYETTIVGQTSTLGIATATKLHVGVDTGFHSEELVVTGDARVTGILTIGTGSITLDPNAKKITGVDEIIIGTATTVRIHQDTSGEVVFSDRDGKPASVGIGTTVSINTTGIITATSFFGDGSQLTNIISGVGIQSTSTRIGTGYTDINFTGVGVTVVGSGTTITIDVPTATITRQTETITGVTTVFTITGGYDVGKIDVYVNGAKQISGSDYTASNGTTVTMTPFVNNGDVVEFQKIDQLRVAGITSTTNATNAFNLNSQAASHYLDYDNFTNTPTIPTNNNQLTNGAGFITGSSSGVELTGIVTSIVAGDNITISGSTGIVTITSTSSGGGSGISSVGIQSGGVLVGTAQTINFGSGVTITNDVATVSVGSTLRFVGARMYHDDYSVTTSGSWTEVANFDGTSIDTNSFANATNGRFTIPAGVSKVRISTNIRVAANGNTNNQWSTYKNGSILRVINGGFNIDLDGTSGYSNPGAFGQTAIISVVEGDYFNIRYYVSNTSLDVDLWYQIEVVEGDILGTYFSATNIVDDTSPQLGGNLDINGKNITGIGNVNLTGIVTATTFYGDGSNLTNAGASAAKSAAIASFLGR